MTKKILLVIANILLLLLPASPVIDSFSPHLNGNTFSFYLGTCCIFCLVLLLFALFVHYKNKAVTNGSPKLISAGWLFFALGMLIIPPLHMGAPPMDESLVKKNYEEQFRYIMLLASVIIFLSGVIITLLTLWHKLKLGEKAVIIPLLLAVSVSLWDYYDSYQFGAKMSTWVSSGKSAAEFFPNYNFHETWRALGRILLYVNAIWLCFILLRQSVLKKWIAVTLIIFCFAGIGFCFTFLAKGIAFYFPFMVPAVALSPAYWIGIALLNKRYAEISTGK